jgi:hypothetical protein
MNRCTRLDMFILPETACTERSQLDKGTRGWKKHAFEINIYEKALVVAPTEKYDQAQ